jgi:hypothetical protein
MRKTILTFCICSLAYVVITQATFGQVRYDAAGDFSLTNNPNGAWSYGWVSATNLDLILYTIIDTPYGLKEWTGPFPRDPNLTTVPCVIVNDTGTSISAIDNVYQVHRLNAHPGPNNERSVVRWTAPESGAVRIASAFEGRDAALSTTTGGSVYYNGNRLFIGAVNGYGAASRISFTTNLLVAAGDTVAFIVDYGSNGNYYGDTTQVDATITLGAFPTIRVAEVEICWASVSNRLYRVDYQSVLTSNLWPPLSSNIVATSPITCVSDRTPEGQPRRFYRAVLLPQ